MTNSPTEPSAILREAAAFYWQTFVALTNEGFTEAQALQIIAEIIRAGFGGNTP
jgi:hypothetical protein